MAHRQCRRAFCGAGGGKFFCLFLSPREGQEWLQIPQPWQSQLSFAAGAKRKVRARPLKQAQNTFMKESKQRPGTEGAGADLTLSLLISFAYSWARESSSMKTKLCPGLWLVSLDQHLRQIEIVCRREAHQSALREALRVSQRPEEDLT